MVLLHTSHNEHWKKQPPPSAFAPTCPISTQSGPFLLDHTPDGPLLLTSADKTLQVALRTGENAS